MNALIAFRRLITPNLSTMTPYYQVVVSIRNYACFNGFNFDNAFRKVGAEGDAFFRANLQGHTDLRMDDTWYPSSEVMNRAARDSVVGEWETLGIGWLYQGARTSQNEVPMQTQLDFEIGKFLRKEGFQRQYYDAMYGRTIETQRPLTPNEHFLSSLFHHQSCEDHKPVNQSARARSVFANAVHNNQSAAGCLYQFVGSERPSGQAVSYLQTFRNISEAQISGWSGSLALKLAVIKAVLNSLRPGQSPMAIFDVVHNYGTDNAIIAYAGPLLCAHITKFGFWSATEFYRNSNSMMQEGRYNKGAQSDTLMTNFRRKWTEAHSGFTRNVMADIERAIAPEDGPHIFEAISRITRNSSFDLTSYSNMSRIVEAARGGELDRWITRYSQVLRALSGLDIPGVINRFMTAVGMMVDVRRPPEPVTPPPTPARPRQPASESATARNTTAGAAIGFTQWTATVH